MLDKKPKNVSTQETLPLYITVASSINKPHIQKNVGSQIMFCGGKWVLQPINICSHMSFFGNLVIIYRNEMVVEKN